jgi:hypothetical protein
MLQKFKACLAEYVGSACMVQSLPLDTYNSHNSALLAAEWTKSDPIKRFEGHMCSENDRYGDNPLAQCLVRALWACQASFSHESFDIDLCMRSFMVVSDSWSFRDINKFVENVRSAVLGLET